MHVGDGSPCRLAALISFANRLVLSASSLSAMLFSEPVKAKRWRIRDRYFSVPAMTAHGTPKPQTTWIETCRRNDLAQKQRRHIEICTVQECWVKQCLPPYWPPIFFSPFDSERGDLKNSSGKIETCGTATRELLEPDILNHPSPDEAAE